MGQVDSVEQAAKAAQGKKPLRRSTLHWRTRGGRAARLMLRSLASLLLILCVLEILRLTFVPSPGSVAFAHTNLHPFATIRLLLRDGTIDFDDREKARAILRRKGFTKKAGK